MPAATTYWHKSEIRKIQINELFEIFVMKSKARCSAQIIQRFVGLRASLNEFTTYPGCVRARVACPTCINVCGACDERNKKLTVREHWTMHWNEFFRFCNRSISHNTQQTAYNNISGLRVNFPISIITGRRREKTFDNFISHEVNLLNVKKNNI